MEPMIADAKSIQSNYLPEKSKEKYLQVYNTFVNWKEENEIDERDFSEETMIDYFNHLKNKYKASTLWVFYSMLRTSIQLNDNVDINYPQLNTFLKSASVGYLAKKAIAFQPDEIRKFLCEAPDIDFLATKVIMIFGIYGATQANELTKIDVKDINEHGDIFVIKIPKTKTNAIRTFTLENDYARYVRKYLNLRPSTMSSSRFFIHYQKGKCSIHPTGRNKFLSTPKVIAKFLNLPNPEQYTCHSFRRTSATLLADPATDTTTLNGGWWSTSAADGYVQDSIQECIKSEPKIENMSPPRGPPALTYKLPCPRSWSPDPLLTEDENWANLFQEYLPECIIQKVTPLNNNRKPYCFWQVEFTSYYLSDDGDHDAETVFDTLSQEKPRNAIIKNLRAIEKYEWVIEYQLACQCKHALNFSNKHEPS